MFIVSILTFFATNAGNIPFYERGVTAYLDNNGNFYNLNAVYGSEITYAYADPSDKDFQIKIKGISYSVDFDAAFRSATTEIVKQLNLSSFRFSESRAKVVDLKIETTNYLYQAIAAGIFKRFDSRGFATLIFFKASTEKILPLLYDEQRSAGVIPPDETIPEYLQLILRYTIIHEVGHILGLSHSNEIATSAGQVSGIVVPSSSTTDIPIMYSNIRKYFESMRDELSRPVKISDIRFSRIEVSALRKLFAPNAYYTISSDSKPIDHLSYMYGDHQIQFLGKLTYLADDDPRLLPKIANYGTYLRYDIAEDKVSPEYPKDTSTN